MNSPEISRRCELVGGGRIRLSMTLKNAVDTATGEVVEVVLPTTLANTVQYSAEQLDVHGAPIDCFLRGELGKRVVSFEACVECPNNPQTATTDSN